MAFAGGSTGALAHTYNKWICSKKQTSGLLVCLFGFFYPKEDTCHCTGTGSMKHDLKNSVSLKLMEIITHQSKMCSMSTVDTHLKSTGDHEPRVESANTRDNSIEAKASSWEAEERWSCSGAPMNSPTHFWAFLENVPATHWCQWILLSSRRLPQSQSEVVHRKLLVLAQ